MLPEVILRRELDESSPLAAWNLRPTLGFSGITWTSRISSVFLGSPQVPGSLDLWTSISPPIIITMILAAFYLPHGKFGRTCDGLPRKIPGALG